MCRWPIALALVLVCHAGSAGPPPEPIPEERQILVMLSMAPAHFRPDTGYGGDYGVDLGHRARRRLAAELARRHGLVLSQDWAMPALGVDCFVMEVPTRLSIDEILARLAGETHVESVQVMHRFHGLGHTDPLYAAQPAAILWRLDALHTVATGRTAEIALIDTGVDAGHPDLAGRIVEARNFVDDSHYTAEDHGTAVAGIAAANADNGVGIVGVAPDVHVLALRACWQSAGQAAYCNSFTLAKALQFALDRRSSRVVNLSLTGPRDRLLERLIERLLQRGAVVVAASDPSAADGGFPASYAGVLPVRAQGAAADEDRGIDEFLAPGRDVPTTLPGVRWGFVTGASFAAAHVSGLVALMLDAAPSLDAAAVRSALRGARHLAGADSHPRATRIDACAAVARATGVRWCQAAPATSASME